MSQADITELLTYFSYTELSKSFGVPTRVIRAWENDVWYPVVPADKAVADWLRAGRMKGKAMADGQRVSLARARERDAAVELLRGWLKHGPRRADRVREDAFRKGVSDRDLRTAYRTLGVVAEREGQRSLWSLPG